MFSYNMNGGLIREAQVNGTLQKIVPKLVRAQILYWAHYLVFAGHLSERGLDYTRRREY